MHVVPRTFKGVASISRVSIIPGFHVFLYQDRKVIRGSIIAVSTMFIKKKRGKLIYRGYLKSGKSLQN
jgi:hypothetical protein